MYTMTKTPVLKTAQIKTQENLSASMEDYLEAIFHIIAEKEAVRPKDIADRLSVSNASVTGALRSLSEKGLINYAPYDVITLTESGKVAAKDVIHRHQVLRDFFVNVLAIAPDVADEASCRMEHSLSGVIMERFVEFARFLDVCPRGGNSLISGFRYYCDHEGALQDCTACVSTILEQVRQKDAKSAVSKRPIALNEAVPAQKYKVVAINKRTGINRRLIEMGVTPGDDIEVDRISSKKGIMDIKVKGYLLPLHLEEAAGIIVEPG